MIFVFQSVLFFFYLALAGRVRAMQDDQNIMEVLGFDIRCTRARGLVVGR